MPQTLDELRPRPDGVPRLDCLVALYKGSFADSARHTRQHTALACANASTNNTERAVARSIPRLLSLFSYSAGLIAVAKTLVAGKWTLRLCQTFSCT
jgi:hypothetical protein